MQLKISFVLLFSLLTISLAANVTVFDDLGDYPLDTESKTTTLKPIVKNVTGNNLTDYVPTSPHGIIKTKTTGTEKTKPELPQNITVKSIENSVDTWEVHVDWQPPSLLPDSYTLTLLADNNVEYKIESPGNASEVVFKDVKAEDYYNFLVWLQARIGNTTASCVTSAWFEAVADLKAPNNITVKAVRDSVDTWEVYVRWELSHVLPDSYTVSLSTEEFGNHTIVIPGNQSEVVFKNVKAEGAYFLSVEARKRKQVASHGSREWFPGALIRMLRVQNVTVEAIKDSVDTWEVHVGWGKPLQISSSYIVELHSEIYGSHATVIPWNESEAVFKNVKGEGTYDVVIKSEFGDTTATSSTRARFPSNGTNTTTIILSTLGFVLVFVVIYIAWTKRNLALAGTTLALPATAHRFEPFYPNMLFRKECDREIEEIEQHVYEEVGPPIYDVIAPSICSYEEIAPSYEEINPSDVDGG